MDDLFQDKQVKKIHIRIQQNGRRNVTTVQGLDQDLDLHRILKALKKAFNCNGSIDTHEQFGEILQLQGDQRETVVEWLLAQEILTKEEVAERVVIHGA
jgi:translation initiation factor 1